ncbi:MAG: hypothetical protein U0Y68_14525, partial [Blastocatellia bacterium]
AKKAAEKKDCTPFFVEVAVMPSDNREIHFGLTKACNPVVWTIDFMLREEIGGEMKTRVKVHVRVGPEKVAKAEKLAETKNLTPTKVNLLQGRVADRAAELPSGTTNDEELEGLLTRVL